jgi:ABC-type antimicrobial peptide transport system permease subunit
LNFAAIFTAMPLLESLETTQFYALYLGLVLNIITFVLLFLSVLLIYSLLMISVETRQHEMGVLRMVGARRHTVVALLLMQSFAYALPGWVLGLAVAQVCSSIVAAFFEAETSAALDPLLAGDAVAMATFLAVAVPLVAAMAPIRASLGHSLAASLDEKRSKTMAVKIDIHRASNAARVNNVFLLAGA